MPRYIIWTFAFEYITALYSSIIFVIIISQLKRALIYCLLTLGVGLIVIPPCSSQAIESAASFNISSIEIAGNQRTDSRAITEKLERSSGSFTSDQITEQIKEIYRTGFFEEITASIVESANGKVLRYTVIEKPIVRKIFISGNEQVDEDDLSEIFSLGTMRFLDKSSVDGIIRNATAFYQSRGYYDVSFDYKVDPVGENQVDVNFKVDEGKRFKISKISFRGLEAVDSDELRGAIQTRRYKWWNSWLYGTGRLNKPMLENDRNVLRQHFFDHGYIDVVVSEPVVEKKGGYLEISFDVSEGQQYSVGAISASGTLLDESMEKTLEGIQSSRGEVFNASELREDAFIISEKFTDIGYAYANVVPDTATLRDSGEVNINFEVDPGQLVYVRRVNISGNEKTYDNVIRRELKIDERELFSSSKLQRSQILLERLGYFEEVNVSTEPTDSDDLIDILTNVREGSTGQFSAGAGFSSSDGALFNARLSENNLFGTGRRATINADIGTERENLVFSINDRRVNDTYISLGGSLLKTEREFDDFDRELAGGSFSSGYPFEEAFGEWFEDISGSIKYEYLDIEITNVNPEDAAELVIESEGKSSSSAITLSLNRNTINNPLNPVTGSRQALSVELAGLGGTEEYYLIDARQYWYYPLLRSDYGDLVFSWRARFGYGKTYDDDPFPLFRRYFPGGINSVRGFEARTLGPEDSNGNNYGGSKQIVNNVELIFPLINSAGLKGVVFYDVGEAFDDDVSIEFGELREAYGYGIRWTSPLGPIRLEFGFPLDKEEGEDSMVTQFSFGAPL